MSEQETNEIPQSHSAGLARSAGTVSAGVGLSRIFGLIREQTFAYVFGAGLANDAFVVAFRRNVGGIGHRSPKDSLTD
jgi:putative peptidoglycan lipid II flippase